MFKAPLHWIRDPFVQTRVFLDLVQACGGGERRTDDQGRTIPTRTGLGTHKFECVVVRGEYRVAMCFDNLLWVLFCSCMVLSGSYYIVLRAKSHQSSHWVKITARENSFQSRLIKLGRFHVWRPGGQMDDPESG